MTTDAPEPHLTIEACPTCGQRVHVEPDGRYRPIAELQGEGAHSRERTLELFLLTLLDQTRSRPKRDYHAAIRDLHKRIYNRVGWKRHWIETRAEEAEARVTVGGLAEAHEAVCARVERGELP